MAVNTLEEDLATISIGCCATHLDETVETPSDIEYESEGQNDATLKQPARQSRLVSRVKRFRSTKGLMSNFTRSLTNGNRHKNSHMMHHDSGAGGVSASDVASVVATEYFALQGPDPELLSMPSLLDESKGDYEDLGEDFDELKKADTVTACSTIPSEESFDDSLALEVGHSAHAYLEECFYTEVAVLDREKFNAVPEIVKSDYAITGHLGKGSYSDVFGVVRKGQSGGQMSNNIPSSTGSNRRRPTRGRRSTLSSSVTAATLSRPSQFGERRAAFAMKCLRPQIRSDPAQFTIGAEDLIHETAMLASLDHPNIIKVHGRASGHLKSAFMLNDGYFILLDKLHETLHERIAVWKRDKCAMQGSFMSQIEIAHSIADAMSYLHSKNIISRDLKPDNVGFDSMGVLKLFDFGFAIGLPEKNESDPDGFLFDKCGTPRYMSPEVGLSLGYSLPADVYSFGILFWEMCAQKKPFSSINSADVFEKAVFMGTKRPDIKSHWPTAMKDLMSSCWMAAPSERPTMLDVKSTLSYAMNNNADGKKAPRINVRSKMTRTNRLSSM